jgi:hypothetical protein
MTERAPPDAPAGLSGHPLAGRALATLDGVVVVCLGLGMLYLATGGLDLGLLSVRRVSKPFLLLLVLASLRAALPGRSWLPRLLARARQGAWGIAAGLERRTFWAAAAFDALVAVLTRPNGILIAVPLGLLALAAAFCAFAYRLSGDPLGWLRAQAHWGYTVGNRPWNELMRMLDGLDRQGLYGYFFSDPLAPYYFVHGVVALAFVALVPSVFTRVGVALGAYVAVSLYVPLTGNALEGVGRYAATLFPAFMLLGSVRSPRLHEAFLIASAIVLSLLASLFVLSFPIY